MLTDLLNPDASNRARRSIALATPGLWPASPELAARALAQGFSPPGAQLPRGVAWIVSVDERVPSVPAALWWLTTASAADDWTAEFVHDAARSLASARRHALRDLPVVCTLNAPPARSWRAVLKCAEPDLAVPTVLKGTSFGLAMCIAQGALALDQAVPADLLATAEVLPDGWLESVGGLEQKLRVVVRGGLGITRLFVAFEQKKEAEDILAGYGAELFGRTITVYGPRTLREAFGLLFEDLSGIVAARWTSAAGGAAAAGTLDELWRVTLAGDHEMLCWSGVERAARLFKTTLGAVDPGRARRADAIAAIASRHQGRGTLLGIPEDEWLLDLPKPIRLRYIAHAVQSAADHGDGSEDCYLDLAGRYVARRGDRFGEDLRVRGAVGRVLATLERYEEASATLAEAVSDWFAIELDHEASYALCEWVRVLGLNEKASELDHVAREHGARIEHHPQTSTLSIGFQRLALGVAWTRLRRWDNALAELASDLDWDHLAPLRGARLRWLARAHVERDAGRAIELRRELGDLARRDAGERTNHLLATMDAALEADDAGAWTSAFAELVGEVEDAEARRVMRRQEMRALGPGEVLTRAEAERFLRAYRY
ncbi:MAG: hypothetical protein Q8S73_20450 [Deltaproteobacteria bacterium]|nr:hypothetical protein [Myxococcales bacterium]MDP3216491.1 hypothetical protein [Deltaproteobacteria bacterium]